MPHPHHHPGTIYQDSSPYDFGGRPYGHYQEYHPDPYMDPTSRKSDRERWLASMERNRSWRAPGTDRVDHGFHQIPRNTRRDDSLHSNIHSQREASKRSLRRRHSIGSGHSRDNIMHEVSAAMEQEYKFNSCNHCGQAVIRCQCTVFHHNMEPIIDMSHHTREHSRHARRGFTYGGSQRDMESRLASSGSVPSTSLFDTFGIRYLDDSTSSARPPTSHRPLPRPMPRTMTDNEMLRDTIVRITCPAHNDWPAVPLQTLIVVEPFSDFTKEKEGRIGSWQHPSSSQAIRERQHRRRQAPSS